MIEGMNAVNNPILLDRIKCVIHEEVLRSSAQVLQVWLFGSRARGTASATSDWDIFVVIDKDIAFANRGAIAQRIRWRLAQIGIPCDIVIRSERVFKESLSDTGRLAYYVMKEGIPL
jgi:predicted nucleotidyltransferase